MPGRLHHVEWCVRDAKAAADKLVRCFGFKRVGVAGACHQQTGNAQVVASGNTVFLITQRHEHGVSSPSSSPSCSCCYPLHICCADSASHSRDSLFNVCLSVGDVDAVTDRVRATGAHVIVEPRNIDGAEVRYSVVRSIVGNITHTIINRKAFSGAFLPGFVEVEDEQPTGPALTSYMDHVTYVCETGESESILEWYSSVFGMRRFLVNPMEVPEDGVVIGQEVGMRMKVAEWLSSWLCSEVGVQTGDPECAEDNFKLVLAEPLLGRADSHVQRFLDEHGGPGLQHIGLTTEDIATAVNVMRANGAEFRRPPPTYYKMEEKVAEIEAAGCDVSVFSDLGLLLDSEADYYDGEENNADDQDDHSKVLVQVFTKPFFEDQETFFLEVLQRRGARGFGAGNITALARSIQLHQQELEQQQQQQQQQELEQQQIIVQQQEHVQKPQKQALFTEIAFSDKLR